MKVNQKDTKVTASNQSGSKKQAGQFNTERPSKMSDTMQKPTPAAKGERDKPEKEIERPSREHQHDFKTPETNPNRLVENKDKSQKIDLNKNANKMEDGKPVKDKKW